MAGQQIKLTWRISVMIMLVLIGNINCAVNLVKNGDFSSHTSIAQIDDWIILNYYSDTQQSSENNWILEPNT